MKRFSKRIQKGFQKLANFYVHNVIKAVTKIVNTGVNIEESAKSIVSDILKDINQRLNRQDSDLVLEQEDEVDESEENALAQFCYGQIFGKNYGIRTFLEYEEECEDGITCKDDIDANLTNDAEENDLFFAKKGNTNFQSYLLFIIYIPNINISFHLGKIICKIIYIYHKMTPREESDEE